MEHVINPLTGLKASLARMLSGGLLGLIFGLLFRRRFMAALAKLEAIYAQWQAGTLVVPPTRTKPAPIPRTPSSRQRDSRTRTPSARRRKAVHVDAGDVPPAAERPPQTVFLAAQPPYPPAISPRVRVSARCTTSPDSSGAKPRPIHYDYATNSPTP